MVGIAITIFLQSALTYGTEVVVSRRSEPCRFSCGWKVTYYTDNCTTNQTSMRVIIRAAVSNARIPHFQKVVDKGAKKVIDGCQWRFRGARYNTSKKDVLC